MDDLMAKAAEISLWQKVLDDSRKASEALECYFLLQNSVRWKFKVSILLPSEALVKGNKLELLENICLIKISVESALWTPIAEAKKPFGYLFVDNNPDTAVDKQLTLSDNHHVYLFVTQTKVNSTRVESTPSHGIET